MIKKKLNFVKICFYPTIEGNIETHTETLRHRDIFLHIGLSELEKFFQINIMETCNVGYVWKNRIHNSIYFNVLSWERRLRCKVRWNTTTFMAYWTNRSRSPSWSPACWRSGTGSGGGAGLPGQHGTRPLDLIKKKKNAI